MKTKQVRKILISVLAAVFVLCAALAFVACSGSKNGSYDVGEEGVYYYAENASTEYILSMQSGSYMITMGGDVTSSGSYTADGETGEIDFGKGSFHATLLGNKLSLDWDGGVYVFHLRVWYDVSFVGPDGTHTEKVLNGTPVPERDGDEEGYVFLGWYADEELSVPYAFTGEVSSDTVIYGRYEKIEAGVKEYAVTFDYGDGKKETTRTVNGKVYESFLPEISGGWWVSATNTEGELTYRYAGERLYEDTTLFAVSDEGLGTSVYDDGVVWDLVATSATVTVYSEDGVIHTATVMSSDSYAYDFSSLPAGRYTVTVTASGRTDERMYVARGLKRVSGLEVAYPAYLVYGSVGGAEKYVIKVEDADGETVVDNGKSLVYDFSSHTMGGEGVAFTVYAIADGMYPSASERYVYLSRLEPNAATSEGDVIVWGEVRLAAYYEVYLDGELVAKTSETSWSAIYLEPGTYAVEIRPVTEGYFSEKSAPYIYNKDTLAAPVVNGVTGGVVSWEAVNGASGYVVEIGDVTYPVTATTFAVSEGNLPDGAADVTFRVKALADGTVWRASSYCDPVRITLDGAVSALTYENGTLGWDYALYAEYFVVQVNGEDETIVKGANRCEVTLTKYGDNALSVYFVDGDGGRSSVAAITVFAYAVILDARGGEIEGGSDVVYLAAGDEIVLPSASMECYDFSAWYTLPDLTNFDSDASLEYSGAGVAMEPGTVFSGGENRIYYAFYTPAAYTATFHAGDGYFVGEDGGPVYGEDGGYASELYVTVYHDRAFVAPEVTPFEDGASFSGWYDEKNGAGKRYADENGASLLVWDKKGDGDLYAGYLSILSYSLTTYEREMVASVSKGKNIDGTAEVTIPETCLIDGVEYVVAYIGVSAFNSCQNLKVLNLPDTVRYIATVGNGYSSGSGAFAQCGSLSEVNVYATGEEENATREIAYYSYDGILYGRDGDGAALVYYPRGRTGACEIPGTVSNENEYGYVGQTLVKTERPVETISSQVFRSNQNLTSVVIPSSVRTIGAQAFYGCAKLSDVVFLESDTLGASLDVSEDAFAECSEMTTMTLPSHLTSFYASSFPDTLTEINVAAGGAVYSSREGYICDSTGSTILYAPRGVTGFSMSSAGVTAIGEGAFEWCARLKSAVIGSSIGTIGERAFYGCSNLSSLVFEGTADSIGLSIASHAFYGCTSLTSVTLPENLSSLGAHAFGNCVNLTSVAVLSASVSPDYENLAFASDAGTFFVTSVSIGKMCGALNITGVFGPNVRTVTLEEGNPYYTLIDGVLYDAAVTEIAFYPYGKSSYETPSSLERIGDWAFQGRGDLVAVSVGTGVVEIGEGAFWGCTGLVSVVFEDADDESLPALEICDSAFYGCTSLSEISVPERLVAVGDSAFAGCSSLKDFTITKNLTRIGGSEGDVEVRTVFADCASLEMIYVEEGNPCFSSEEGILYDSEKTQLYYASKAAGSTSGGVVTIAESVERVWSGAFYGNEGMTRLSFADGINYDALALDAYGFSGCANLSEIDLPEGVRTLSEGLFSDCPSLTAVTIPAGVERIEVNLFAGDENLAEIIFESRDEAAPTPLVLADGTEDGGVFSGLNIASVSLPEGTAAVSDYAFYGCENLSSVYIPFTALAIGSYALAGCGTATGLNVEFAEGSLLSSVGGYAFSLTVIKSANFEDCGYLSSLGGRAFYGVSAEKLTFPGSLTDVGSEALYYAGVRCVEMPGAESIGDRAFMYSDVETVVLGAVGSLGNEAFRGCERLTELSYSAAKSGLTLGYSCFEDCASLVQMYVPEGATSLGDGCFMDAVALEYVLLPSTLRTIGENCFYGCASLYTVDFATDSGGYSDLQSVGDWAFFSSGIERFSFPKTRSDGDIGKIAINGDIFDGCEKLDYLYISESVTDISGILVGNESPMREVSVAEGSENFSMVEGVPVVFNKEMTAIRMVCGSYEDGGTLDLSSFDAVTTLGKYAAAYSSTFKKIILPASLEVIEDHAFFCNSGLEEIVVPSVSELGDYAFNRCSSVKTVTFGDGATIASLGTNAFYECTALEEVVLPVTVTAIGKNALQGCSSLKTIDLSYVTSYGDAAFRYCSSLEEITLADGLTSLGASTAVTGTGPFSYCTSLKVVHMPTTLTFIGAGAFYGCESLSDMDFTYVKEIYNATFTSYSAFSGAGFTTLYIPSTLTVLGGYAFYGCEKLETVVFDGGWCGTMGTNVFYECPRLSSVSLPDNAGFTAVPSYSFYGCALAALSLPESVETVGDYAFYGNAFDFVDLSRVTAFGQRAFASCANLKSVTWSEELTGLSGADYLFFGSGIETLEFPKSLTTLSTNLLYGCADLKSVTFPEGVTSIPNFTCYNCCALEEVTFEGKVTEIGTNAFQSCTSLKEISAPYVTSVGTYSFGYCSALERVDMPSLKSIGANAFYYCSALVEIDTSNVTTLAGSYAFEYCTSLKKIDLSSVASLSSSNTYTFYGCTSLETVLLNDDLTYLPGYMFYGCSSLKYINIPSALTTLGGNYVFYGCDMDEVTLPSGVTSIPLGTFYRCKSLRSVTIQGNVTSVPDSCFYGCTSLEDVSLPLTVKTIGSQSFRNCTSLESVTIPSTVTTIGDYAFAGCAKLEYLIIPESVTQIGEYAFADCASLSELWMGSRVASIGVSALEGCMCDLYMVNTEEKVAETLGEDWVSYTGFEGTVYCYADSENAGDEERVYGGWYVEDGKVVKTDPVT